MRNPHVVIRNVRSHIPSARMDLRERLDDIESSLGLRAPEIVPTVWYELSRFASDLKPLEQNLNWIWRIVAEITDDSSLREVR